MKPPYQYEHTQVHRVALRFGGYDVLARAIGRSEHRVKRWRMPANVPHGGTGGVIPSSVMDEVLTAAQLLGINLTAYDLDPRKLSPNTLAPIE